MEETVSLSVAAKMSERSVTTIRRWIKENQISATKENNEWKIETHTLKNHLANHHRASTLSNSIEQRNTSEAYTELTRSLERSLEREQRKVDRLMEQNSKLQSELLKLTYEMQSILRKESRNKLSRWIKDVVS